MSLISKFTTHIENDSIIRKDITPEEDRFIKQELVELAEPISVDGKVSRHFIISSVKGSMDIPGFEALNEITGHGYTNNVDETIVFTSDSLGNVDETVMVFEPHDHEKALNELLGE